MYRVALMFVIAALLLAGCTAQPGAPSGKYEMQGNISEVHPAAPGEQALGTIRVEGEKIEGNAFDVAVVTITRRTRIWERTAAGYVTAGWDDLQFGATVTIQTTGVVRESWPVQVDAEEVVILYRMPQQ